MNLKWYVNRLRAMNLQELRWRLDQKKTARLEEKVFGKQQVSVTDAVFYPDMADLTFHPERIIVPEALRPEKVSDKITLLGGYDYERNKKNWHGGFQTENEWPLMYSSHLEYKQRDEIGDARTNWELSRHLQFATLGYAYRETKEEAYLLELMDLFSDWNQKNPYLWGISWTSPMEIAIRAINWIYTYSFIAEMAPAELGEMLQDGIINMITYLCAHYSRFSSANNHVIVEAAAIGIAGIAFDCRRWLELAVSILQEEIPRQNCQDGVNREVSLHYQAFFMEAVGLLAIHMRRHQINVPMRWRYILSAMTGYLLDCQGSFGEVMVFADDDEGQILNLSGEKRNYYDYVSALMREWLPAPIHAGKRLSTETLVASCYPEGGVSLIHSVDGNVFAGIDHGPLGFGGIAAHGHADALSFQLFLEGKRVFADPGTGLYHCDLPMRNQVRSTIEHNTLTVDGKDQSEMLGAFLWGKKANTLLKEFKTDLEGRLILSGQQDGYRPILHSRGFIWQGDHHLQIVDRLAGVKREVDFVLGFLMEPGVSAVEIGLGEYRLQTEHGYVIRVRITGEERFTSTVSDATIACGYGNYKDTRRIQIAGRTDKNLKIITDMEWEKQ